MSSNSPIQGGSFGEKVIAWLRKLFGKVSAAVPADVSTKLDQAKSKVQDRVDQSKTDGGAKRDDVRAHADEVRAKAEESAAGLAEKADEARGQAEARTSGARANTQTKVDDAKGDVTSRLNRDSTSAPKSPSSS